MVATFSYFEAAIFSRAINLWTFFLSRQSLLPFVLPQLLQFLARWLNLLRLQSRFHYIQRISNQSSQTTSSASTDEVPEVRVLALPGANHGLKILVAADDAAGERDVHRHCNGVRAVKTAHALLFNYVTKALSWCQMFAQLKSLFHHYKRKR